MILATFED
jgi:Ca2+-transporting ATPase